MIARLIRIDWTGFARTAHWFSLGRLVRKVYLPHLKAELNSDGSDPVDGSGIKLSDRIHNMLFSEAVEDAGAHVA